MSKKLAITVILGLCFSIIKTELWAQCIDPGNLSVSNTRDNSAILSWALDNGTQEYRVAVRISGNSSWTVIATITEPPFQLNMLLPGTNYQWGVRAICSQNTSNFIFGPDFITSGNPACGVPENLTSQPISEESVSLSWDMANGSTSYRVIYWIRDALGDETDPSPNFLFQEVNENSLLLEGLQSGTTYHWTVRNSCGNIPMQSALSEFGTFQTPGTIRCQDPVNLVTTFLNNGNLELSCDPAPGATEYRFAYHQIGTAQEWTEIIQGNQTGIILNIIDGMEYEWGVRTICANYHTVSDFIMGTNFIGGLRCRAPRNLRAFERSFGIVLRWGNRNEAVHYEVQIRESGSVDWTVFEVPFFITVLSGFIPGTTYEWRVRSICDSDGGFKSEYSEIATFSTSATSSYLDENFSVKSTANFISSRIFTTSESNLKLHKPDGFIEMFPFAFGPNPSDDHVIINPVLTKTIFRISIYDTKGSLVMHQIPNTTDEVVLNLRTLRSGDYFIVLETDSGVYQETVIRL